MYLICIYEVPALISEVMRCEVNTTTWWQHAANSDSGYRRSFCHSPVQKMRASCHCLFICTHFHKQ